MLPRDDTNQSDTDRSHADQHDTHDNGGHEDEKSQKKWSLTAFLWNWKYPILLSAFMIARAAWVDFHRPQLHVQFEPRIVTAADLPPLEPAIPLAFDESKYVISDGPMKIPRWARTRKDLPFDVVEFLNARSIEPLENAAPRYVYAMIYLYSMPASSPLRLIDPEFTLRVHQFGARYQELDQRRRESPETFTLNELQLICQDFEPYLQLVDWAQERQGCQFFKDHLSWSEVVDLSLAGSVIGGMTSFEVIAAAQQGDLETLLKCCRRVWRLSQDLNQTLSDGLLAADLVDRLMSVIQQEVLLSDRLTAEDLTKLLQLLNTMKWDPMMHFENEMKLNFIQNQQLIESLAGTGFWVGADLAAVDRQLTSDWTKRLLRASLSDPRDRFRATLQVCEEIKREYEELSLEDNEVKGVKGTLMRLFGQSSTPLIPLTLESQTLGISLRKQYRTANEMNATLLLTAIEISHRQNGHYPQNDEELLAAIQQCGLDSIPIDLMNGLEPLHYRLLNEQPIVYSVGLDQVDDEGLIDDADVPRRLSGDTIYRIGRAK